MIGFGLTDYPSFGIFLHLDEIVNKYKLKATNVGVDYSLFGGERGKYLN